MKNLFIIGAQRSGTTFLNKAICMHPKIIGIDSSIEEPKTFLNESWPRSSKEYNKINNLDGKDYAYSLEKSTSYYENLYSAFRIKSVFPDSKILFIARDPIQRIISNYEFSKKNGLENLDFEDAIIRNNRDYKTSVNPYNYLTRSLYTFHLVFWKNLFENNLKIIVFEEMIQDRIHTLKTIFDWLNLELEDSIITPLNEMKSIRSVPRSGSYEDLGKLEASIKFIFKKEKQALEELIGRDITSWNI